MLVRALNADATTTAGLHADERERRFDAEVGWILVVSQHCDELAWALGFRGPGLNVGAVRAAAGARRSQRAQQDESG